MRGPLADSSVWPRSVTSTRFEMRGISPGQDRFSEVKSGGRGIRTHGDVAATMVFKTIAIGH